MKQKSDNKWILASFSNKQKNEKREKFMNEYTNDGTSLEIISTQCVLFNHVYLKDMLK